MSRRRVSRTPTTIRRMNRQKRGRNKRRAKPKVGIFQLFKKFFPVHKWIEHLAVSNKVLLLAQCKECQADQKLVETTVSSVGSGELFVNVVMCERCVEGNIKQANGMANFVGMSGGGETKKGKSKKGKIIQK